jgi:hypothetical protein
MQRPQIFALKSKVIDVLELKSKKTWWQQSLLERTKVMVKNPNNLVSHYIYNDKS